MTHSILGEAGRYSQLVGRHRHILDGHLLGSQVKVKDYFLPDFYFRNVDFNYFDLNKGNLRLFRQPKMFSKY